MKTFQLLLVCSLGICATLADIPYNVEQSGDFTFYNDKGYGACGRQIDASKQKLVAVSHLWFTTSNPNKDPVCTGKVCVKVTYNRKSVTVPVQDKCPSCDRNHLDLSQTAFSQLAPLSVGHVYGAKWSFVRC